VERIQFYLDPGTGGDFGGMGLVLKAVFIMAMGLFIE